MRDATSDVSCRNKEDNKFLLLPDHNINKPKQHMSHAVTGGLAGSLSHAPVDWIRLFPPATITVTLVQVEAGIAFA